MKNLAGTPFSPQKGGIGPLLEVLSPPFKNKEGSRQILRRYRQEK